MAEFFEPRDRFDNELVRDVFAGDRFVDVPDARGQRDPRVVIGAGTAGVHEIEFNDEMFAAVVADALGIGIQREAGGGVSFARPVYASDLASLVRLDASGTSPSAIGGLQYLIGLQTLDLSANGSIANGGLRRLVPANAGAEGTAYLRSLNLDGNSITSLARLTDLTELQVLSVADQQGTNGVASISPLSNLTNLVYVDVSGNDVTDLSPLFPLTGLRVLDAADNALSDLQGFARAWRLDASNAVSANPADVQVNRELTVRTVGGQYSYIDPRTASASATVEWQTPMLPAGSYDVLASWFGDDTHSADTSLLVDGRSTEINQQVDSAGATIGGIDYEFLTSIDLSTRQVVPIGISPGTDGRLLVADTIVVSATQLGGGNLARLDVTDNQLNELSHSFIAPMLESRGVQVDQPNNSAPVWTRSIQNQSAPRSGQITIANLGDYVSDPDGDAVTFSASTDHPGADVSLNGGTLTIADRGATDRLVRVTVTATDARGRSSFHRFNVAFDSTLVSGTIFRDLNKDGTRQTSEAGVEGVLVYVDLNGDKERSPGEPVATSDWDGAFTLWTDRSGMVSVRVDTDSHVDFVLPDSREIDLPSGHGRIDSVNFGIFDAISIDAPRQVAEGTVVEAVATTSTTGGQSLWTVDGGPVDLPADPTGSSFSFTPRQDGIYEVTFEYRKSGRVWQRKRIIEVLPVAPHVAAGDDLTGGNAIPEGRMLLTRPMIVDPGDDVWNVTIDYGDGSAPSVISGMTSRVIALDHIYGDPSGTEPYTVTITVENSEGRDSDSFDVEVVPAGATLEVSEQEVPLEGVSSAFRFSVDDDTERADIVSWTYNVDWGDGTSESIAGRLLFSKTEPGVAEALVEHTYATQGDYRITFTVVDDDGDVSVATRDVTVQNRPPVGAILDSPATVVEDVSNVWSASATDVDEPLTFAWNFGDGTAIQYGASVSHVFADPGTYTVTLQVSDGEDTSEVRHDIIVSNVNDAPRLLLPAVLTLNELQPFSFQASALDPDPMDELRFQVSDGPAGLQIDEVTGLLTWTPDLEQGDRSYTAHVTVSDSVGATDRRAISLEVRAAAAIEGAVFEDLDGDGSWDINESARSGQVVSLDRGGDGIVDATVQTDSGGRYRFDGLEAGMYVVHIDLPESWIATTPTELIVDIPAPRDIVLPSVGGSLRLDYGDAPDDSIETRANDYRTTLASDGPRHVVVPGLRLGRNIDAEFGASAGALADGDDRAGASNDEDGVLDAAQQFRFSVGQRPRVDVVATNQTPDAAVLYAWVDYDGDGQFALDERVQVEIPSGSDSTPFTLVFPQVPASVPSRTYARLRLSTDAAAAAPFGLAADGEVEDYVVEFTSGLSHTNWSLPADINNDGVVTALDALILITDLTTNGPRELPPLDEPPPYYLDPTGDGLLTAADVLFVITYLGGQQGEGEAPPAGTNVAAYEYDEAVGRLDPRDQILRRGRRLPGSDITEMSTKSRQLDPADADRPAPAFVDAVFGGFSERQDRTMQSAVRARNHDTTEWSKAVDELFADDDAALDQ